MSLALPAANGLTTRTERVGQFSASAAVPAAIAAAAAKAAQRARIDLIFSSRLSLASPCPVPRWPATRRLFACGHAGYTAAMSLAADPSPLVPAAAMLHHDWTREEVRALFDLPFPELMVRAQSAHRENFDPAEVQIS